MIVIKIFENLFFSFLDTSQEEGTPKHFPLDLPTRLPLLPPLPHHTHPLIIPLPPSKNIPRVASPTLSIFFASLERFVSMSFLNA